MVCSSADITPETVGIGSVVVPVVDVVVVPVDDTESGGLVGVGVGLEGG